MNLDPTIACEATLECEWSMKAMQRDVQKEDDSLVEMFRRAYTLLNPQMEQGLIFTVTAVFEELVESFSAEQNERAWSSLGRLLSNQLFLKS
jgi:hypothetical protein